MANSPMSSRVATGAVSATSRLSEALAKARGHGHNIIDLAQGEVADVPPAAHVLEAAVKAIRDHRGKYTPAAGMPQLREAIAQWFVREHGFHVSPRGVMASPGAKHAVYAFLMAVLNPGDEVLIPVPYWTSYPDQVRLAGGTPRLVSTVRDTGFKITPELVRSAVTPRTRVLILNNPANPTGAVYTRRELEPLLREVRAHDLLVLADEVYSALTYDGAVHQAFATVDAEASATTVTINAASKTYCMTGWRLGFAAGPEHIIAGMEQVQSHTTSCPNSIAQWATLAALTGEQAAVVNLRRRLAERRRFALDALAGVSGLDCPRPDGAFYIFPSVRGALQRYEMDDAAALVPALVEATGVLTAPGTAFGIPDRLRVCFGASLESLRNGLSRIRPWLAGDAPSDVRRSG